MKKLLFAALLGSTTLGMAQQKGMVHLEAEYSQKDFNEISIISLENSKVVQKIKADANGLFKSDIKLASSGEYMIKAGEKTLSFVYLKNDQNLMLKSSKNDYFSKEGSQSFQGSLAPETTYFATFYDRKVDNLYVLPDAEFKKELEQVEQKHLQEIKMLKNLNTEQQKKAIDDAKFRYQYFTQIYEINKTKGSTVPDFKLENFSDGKLVDFSSLKGKYTLIDVWNTYCMPCIRQMPKLKALEEKFHGKNIQFISISIDKDTQKAAAKAIVEKNKLTNPQFFAHPLYTEPFMKHMKINAPPRFILLDPNGKVLDPNSVYPSDPELEKTLQELLK